MEDFVSNAFFNLIADELRRQGIHSAANSQFSGKATRNSKVELLDKAYSQIGNSALLSIGTGIHRVDFDPTLALLVNAVSVEDLMERWIRLERYMHGHHRVRMLSKSSSSIVLEHYAQSKNGPGLVENLVVAGLFAAMLQAIGINQLNLSIDDHVLIASDSIVIDSPKIHSTNIWHFTWGGFNNTKPDTLSISSEDSVVTQVTQLLSSDLGRSWKLAAVAQILGKSSRSLQRRLAESNCSFQTLLRIARAEGAAKMLLTGEQGLSEISYAAGYADQAHFSREFKLRFNLSPVEYKKLS